MSLSARRRRRRFRLTLIFGVMFLLVAGVGVRYAMVSDASSQPTTDPRRDAGLAAFAAGDHAQVIAELGPYVANGLADTESTFALASTQLKLSEGDPAMLLNAVTGLRAVLANDPNHRGAAEMLLPVFTEFPGGVEQEGIDIAERVLRSDPDHEISLRARAVLLSSIGRNQQALTATRQWVQTHPDDVLVHRSALDVMKRMGQPETALLDYARALMQSDPNRPAFAQVQAYAHLLADETEPAAAILSDLAQKTPADAEFVTQQVALMDKAGMFEDVLTYLEKLHAESDATLPTEELIRRRFEAGHGDEALALIETLESPNPAQRILQTLLLHSIQHQAEAEEVVRGFESAAGRVNQATAGLLTAAMNVELAGYDAVFAAAREANDAGLYNPYVDFVVAEAFARTGQTDQAISRYESALSQRPSWAKPYLGLASLYLQEGDALEAWSYASAAVQRQPRATEGGILLAQAMAYNPAALSAAQQQDVLDLIDTVQQAQPGEPRTMALKIAVLAGTGKKAEAHKAMREALAVEPPLSAPAMLILIDAAQQYGLDLEGEAQAAYVKRYGQTLAITLIQAQRLLDSGQYDAALELYDAARPEAGGVEWDVNRARLLEQIGGPESTMAWSTLGETHADNLQAQLAQLGSAAAWQDRVAIKDAIERLQALTGENDPLWRIEQARWLLGSEDPVAVAEEADALLDAAIRLQPNSTEALALRGRAQRLLGNPRLAISLLNQAVTLSPDNADARAELALAQRDDGSEEIALETARLAASLDDSSSHAQRRAAQLMIDQGDFASAAGVLARLLEADQAEDRDVFTLAQLYMQTRQQSKAMELVETLVESPYPASVALAADLYAQSGQFAKAESALERLSDLGLAPAAQLRIAAEHHAVFGDDATADAAWLALIEVSPKDAEAWEQLVIHRLRVGRSADAIDAAQTASSELSEAEGFAAFSQHAPIITRIAEVPGAMAMGLAILNEDEHREAAVQALDALDQGHAGKISPDALADRLVALAEASPEFESLWVLSVSLEFEAGRDAFALPRAEAARERFPDSAQSARLLAESYAATAQWREALISTEAWAALSPQSTWEIDVLAARANRELGRPDAAAQGLAPYAESVRANPSARPNLTMEMGLAWAATGRGKDARQLLEPLLESDPAWRLVWLDAAVLKLSSTREASQWLETVESAIPADAWSERAALAQAWWSLGMRDSYTPFRDKGRAMGETLTKTPGESGELWFFVGSAAELDQDYSAAEQAYRRALELDESLAGASNNLAMLITDHGGDLNEAVELARRAVDQVPGEPNFHDTLAYVLHRAGRVEEAREAIKRAIELDPGNPLWRTRLNELAIVE
ncbi:tetratricopeptide repeat protein [Algisphaera agarilytica]|uniref:Tetratricopeptide (TPR) repeat protein n=1 Tax=Algisphaera agarilytica TaxID=1385975 RepID=A0A7X0HBN5_9BACT|nr:tetratricopeptide repeat protein [Algisphaera agarilytica]MBB6431410.1 tetratricopeptide (TPR) repeat protein [Algisphaera agarilytica]